MLGATDGDDVGLELGENVKMLVAACSYYSQMMCISLLNDSIHSERLLALTLVSSLRTHSNLISVLSLSVPSDADGVTTTS